MSTIKLVGILLIGRFPIQAMVYSVIDNLQEAPKLTNSGLKGQHGIKPGTQARCSNAHLYETSPIEALSGGSSLATALSLDACPYRATSTPLKPPYFEFYTWDNNSDAGGVFASSEHIFPG